MRKKYFYCNDNDAFQQNMVHKISKETMDEIIKSIKYEVKLIGTKSESNNFKAS